VFALKSRGAELLAHVFEYADVVEEVTARVLAEAVHAAPGPPLVTATGVMDTPVPAALLAWGRTHDGQWMAGIAFLFHRWSRRALVTVWMPASAVQPHAGLDYSDVPRVALAGQPGAWPDLPPRYPQAGPDWTASHLHIPRPNPAGSY
jgi:hypothetical protein